jgi:cellulose synthase (UDP-forming)
VVGGVLLRHVVDHSFRTSARHRRLADGFGHRGLSSDFADEGGRYTTVYLNEPLSLGLAPEGVKEYVTQRSRWCLGFMQIVRGRSGPLSRTSALTIVDRLSLVESFLNWAAIFPARLMGLIVPILYFLLDIKSVRADLSDVASYFLPYFIWHTAAMNWMTRGRLIRRDTSSK